MEKFYDQALDKLVVSINKPEFKKKLIQNVIDPFIQDVYQKTQNYFITIISLYGITILLLLIIMSILVTKKNIN